MENSAADDLADLELLERVAAEAARIALKYFKSENEVWMKPGASPVSQADYAVNDFLNQNLLGERPEYGWISEESKDGSARLDKQRVFIVDPIDGTRGFINGHDQWCISIAVVEDKRPVAAVLACPALGETFSTAKNGPSTLNGEPIICPSKSEIKIATGSKRINDLIATEFEGSIEATEFVPSLAYRLAMVAKGTIDAAFARPGAHEWDLAAADLILENAAGCLIDKNGDAIEYNCKQLHRGGLVACSLGLKKSTLSLAKSAGILH